MFDLTFAESNYTTIWVGDEMFNLTDTQSLSRLHPNPRHIRPQVKRQTSADDGKAGIGMPQGDHHRAAKDQDRQ